MVSTVAGGGGGRTSGYLNGVGTVTKFHYPYGVAVDSVHNVFVADILNQMIRKITTAG